MRNLKHIFSSSVSRLLAVVAAVALCCGTVFAQQTLGGITGEVSDPSGGVVPNVTVTLKAEQTSAVHETQTNGTGAYTFVNLPIGTYTLTYTATGYNVQKTQHIAVQADRTATVNASLKVGETTTTVEVEATPLMNAVDTTNGYVMDTAQIDAAPLPTGSFTGLATQSAGVSAELSGGTGANSGLGNAPIWANGQRDTSNSFSLNGVDVSNLFNGKSTSQVPSARVINSTGAQTSPGGGGGVIPAAGAGPAGRVTPAGCRAGAACARPGGGAPVGCAALWVCVVPAAGCPVRAALFVRSGALSLPPGCAPGSLGAFGRVPGAGREAGAG